MESTSGRDCKRCGNMFSPHRVVSRENFNNILSLRKKEGWLGG